MRKTIPLVIAAPALVAACGSDNSTTGPKTFTQTTDGIVNSANGDTAEPQSIDDIVVAQDDTSKPDPVN